MDEPKKKRTRLYSSSEELGKLTGQMKEALAQYCKQDETVMRRFDDFAAAVKKYEEQQKE